MSAWRKAPSIRSWSTLERRWTSCLAEASSEEHEWLSLLRDTHDLLDICRSTQSEFLRETLESEAEHVNR